MGGADIPSPPDAHPNLWMRLDVPYVMRLVAVLRNEPEFFPKRRPPIGVRRGSPDFRPVVSSRVCCGSRVRRGFPIRRWNDVTARNLISR